MSHEDARFLPAWKILDGEIRKDKIEGRNLLVGTKRRRMRDLRATPMEPPARGSNSTCRPSSKCLHGAELAAA